MISECHQCHDVLYFLRCSVQILVKRWLLTYGVIGPMPCDLNMVSDVLWTSPYTPPDGLELSLTAMSMQYVSSVVQTMLDGHWV